ncbi:MAG: hypothetical protein KDA76_15755 [Planctomycetaceae bacterium]|nr:hypothetical protein [Planctomycetaceae bacterium]
MKHNLSVCLAGLLVWGNCLLPTPAAAQQPVAERLTTELQFDILLPRERPNGVAAQEWAEVFAKLNVPLRIRQPAFNDKAGVDQQIFGTTRRVKVIGQLDRSGLIVFPDRKFSVHDVAKLTEWIEDLRTYGAQGAPEGQPLWGLQKAEFDRLHALMRQPVVQETAGLSLTEAIRALELPAEFPLRFSAETREQLAAQPNLPAVPHDLREFAKGTALAIVLRGYGLSFAPRRLPDESIVLGIDPQAEDAHVWPIGWDPDPLGLKRLALAEKMFTARPIGVEQTLLSELMPQVEKETELKILLDPLSLESLNIDPQRLVINFPRKRTSWSLCLRTILAQIKLTQEIRVDENDRPFIWISRFTPRTLPENR